MTRWPRALLGAAALALLVAPLLRAAEGEGGSADDRRQAAREALEALQDVTEAETPDQLDHAIERFNDKVGSEQDTTRGQLMDRIERDTEE